MSCKQKCRLAKSALASLIGVAFIAANTWRVDKSFIMVLAIAIWGRGLCAWTVLVAGIAIYNWTAGRFGGISIVIANGRETT